MIHERDQPPCQVLSFNFAMKAWSSIYFFWHLAGAAAILFFTLFPLRPRRVKQTQTNGVHKKD